MNNLNQITASSEPQTPCGKLPVSHALIFRIMMGLGIMLGSPVANPSRSAGMDQPATMVAPQPNQEATTSSNLENSDLTDEGEDEITITPVLPRWKANPANRPSTRELLPIDLISMTQVQGESRHAIPTIAQQRDSAKEIKSLLSKEYADRSPAGRSALAKKLLQLSIETDSERVAKYVCADESRQLAIEAVDVETAWAAGDQLCENYAVDESDIRLNAVADLMRKINNPVAASALIDRCQPMVQALIDADQYDQATATSKKLLSLAKKGTDRSVVKKLDELLAHLKVLDREFRALEPALKQLETDPNDAAANQTVGEFYCLAKGDFERGAVYLKNGADKDWRKPANLELAEPVKTASVLKLADAWWELAATKQDADAKAIRKHARAKYLFVFMDLTGLEKAKVEKRLFEGQPIRPQTIVAPASFEIIWQLKDGSVSKDLLIFSADGTYQRGNDKGSMSGTWTLEGNVVVGDLQGPKDYFIFQNANEFVSEYGIPTAGSGHLLDANGVGKRIFK